MKWHLDFDIPKYPFVINHTDKIFTIGSCFAENLAEWLQQRYFTVFSNPNGSLFNPVSIYINLKNILDNPNFFDEKFLFQDDNTYWKSFLHQTHFFDIDQKQLVKKIVDTQLAAHDFLLSSQYLFITFGSAFVYEHVELHEVVANCHKLPSKIFNKQLLEVNQITQYYQELIKKIKEKNPDIKIIFSVSPVKYLAYGLIDNNISKSTLILAIHQICKMNRDCYYFPAYELVVDDLREYRFYKEDMAHPNELAIKYVMEKFSFAILDEETKKIVTDVQKILQAKQHKIQDSSSSKTREFAKKVIEYCGQLEENYPHLNLSKEKAYFEKLL